MGLTTLAAVLTVSKGAGPLINGIAIAIAVAAVVVAVMCDIYRRRSKHAA